MRSKDPIARANGLLAACSAAVGSAPHALSARCPSSSQRDFADFHKTFHAFLGQNRGKKAENRWKTAAKWSRPRGLLLLAAPCVAHGPGDPGVETSQAGLKQAKNPIRSNEIP